MLTEYLTFRSVPTKTKTEVLEVLSQRGGLGHIKWYGAWRQYTFWPAENTIFSNGCLVSINEKIKALMAARKGNGQPTDASKSQS